MGQVLYLEAEAAGVQGTGIGCYFDDVVHQALGIKSTRYAPKEVASGYQDVYHFTVGKAVTDQRIQSEPAYARIETALTNKETTGIFGQPSSSITVVLPGGMA